MKNFLDKSLNIPSAYTGPWRSETNIRAPAITHNAIIIARIFWNAIEPENLKFVTELNWLLRYVTLLYRMKRSNKYPTVIFNNSSSLYNYIIVNFKRCFQLILNFIRVRKEILFNLTCAKNTFIKNFLLGTTICFLFFVLMVIVLIQQKLMSIRMCVLMKWEIFGCESVATIKWFKRFFSRKFHVIY